MHLDPDLAAAVPALPDLHIHDLDGARARMAELTSNSGQVVPGEVTATDHEVPGVDGVPVPVRVLRPTAAPVPLPAVLLLHGGGFVMGGVDSLTAQAVGLCAHVPAVVVAVDYRLAPEHPYPAALRDCEAALGWTASESESLGVDAARIAVYGMSAGGGLAAALTLLVRDRGGPPVRFQVLDAPEVDDRVETFSARTFDETPLWNHADAVLSWRHYLRGWNGDVPAYAAPARADDLSGCPPPTSRCTRTIRCATRAWLTPPACCAPACRSNCTCSPARSTDQRCSQVQRCPNAKPPKPATRSTAR